MDQERLMPAKDLAVGMGDEKAVVLMHSSDLHVDDDVMHKDYSGLMGLHSVLTTAQALGADIVLLAGDTFDNHRVSTPVLRQATDLLAAAQLRVILLPGNHDPALPDCLFRRAGMLDVPTVHVLGVTHPEAIVFAEHDLEIRGRAHRSFDDMPPFNEPGPRKARWQVVMAHGHYVAPNEWKAHAHRAWRISDQDIARTQADYVALGHWDRPTPVGDRSVPAYYSGSPDLAGTANVIRISAKYGVIVSREPLRWDQQPPERITRSPRPAAAR
jgi:DNA repair exonuclease SbcCD nuclease subunit